MLGKLAAEDTLGKTAGSVREAFEGVVLDNYELTRVREGDGGMAVSPNESGKWGLMSWTKWGMVQESR
ncbi:MAG: hypothetical protein ACRDG7_08260 [Candidatus Limnocylindria bacterium]